MLKKLSMHIVGLLLVPIFIGWSALSAAPSPYGQRGNYQLLKDWSFGNNRSDATIRNRTDLDKEFYYRYIYSGGTLDMLPTYWSYHRDYSESDPRSLHVFGAGTLTLKGRIPKGGGLFQRGIESGMLRAKLPITPGMYIEMRAKLPTGLGAWPAFWLNPGVQFDDGSFSNLPWPPEIDIFEFFNWKGRSRTTVLSGNTQSNGKPEKYGNPHDLWTKFTNSEYAPGIDFSNEFHVFALDWRKDRPIWVLDGMPIKQTYYEWHAPPAHLLITNQIGMTFSDLTGMVANESQWDYEIDYIRVWRDTRKTPQSLTDQIKPR